MEAEILDKNGHVKMALNSLGIKINQQTVELVLNISDFVRHRTGNEKDITLREIAEIEHLVAGLFSEEPVEIPKEMKH